MFDWLKKLYGQGRVRIEWKAENGSFGTAKMPFIGAFDSEAELIEIFINECLLEKNIKITKARIIAIEGRNSGECKTVSGEWFSVKRKG